LKKDISSTSFSHSPALILVGGRSKVGKTSLVNYLIENFPQLFSRPISFTTRTKRGTENNDEYIFTTKRDMYEKQKKSEILTIDESYGHLYSISRASIDDILMSGKFAIKEVHPRNFDKISRLMEPVITVLITRSDMENCITAEQEDESRINDDIKFYDEYNELRSDIIIRTETNGDLEATGNILSLKIKAISATISQFPKPFRIDTFNEVGYSKVGRDFSEKSRITTNNFHDLSFQYFNRAFKDYLKKGEKCLEVGPGWGWLEKNFLFDSDSYSSVEISKEMISRSKQADVQRMSVRNLHYPDNYFGIVIASLGDPYFYPVALCEINRVLKPSGVFIFSTPSREWSELLRQKSDHNKTTFILSDNIQASVYSFTFKKIQLSKMLELCDFSVESLQEIKCTGISSDKLSRAITEPAKVAGISPNNLPILNFGIAKKR